jgi:hypothetical protein
MTPPAQLRTPARTLYWETELPNKREIKSPAKLRSSPAPMSTNRNRAGRGTGGSRGNGPDSLEELAMWNSAQEDVRSITRLLARAEECREEIVELEAEFKNREPASMAHETATAKMLTLLRAFSPGIRQSICPSPRTSQAVRRDCEHWQR